ncbi:G protein-coupled glucose receptor regulating Gpa2-domain-containing [Salix suchowensis]|nr:G protein-coupled glucose receptor regulating Gpa2-domain-containing [Salix suchowensis]
MDGGGVARASPERLTSSWAAFFPNVNNIATDDRHLHSFHAHSKATSPRCMRFLIQLATASNHGYRGVHIGDVYPQLHWGILSALGSGFIILCYLALPLRRHFRHVLILNLAVAVNNSASGSQILIKKRELSSGPACVLNGFVGQISVQAADCAILAIAVVTVYTITKTSHSRLVSGEWEWPMIMGVTSAIWLLPFTTGKSFYSYIDVTRDQLLIAYLEGFLALGKHWYAPVSGNWCWLVDNPVHLRYVLTHGWRYLFMLLELILYTYLHIFLRRHFRRLAVPIVSNVPTSSNHFTQSIPLTPVTFAPQPHADGTESKHDVISSSHPGYSTSPFADDDLPKMRGPLTDNPYDAEPSSPIPTGPSQSQAKPSGGALKHVFAHHRAEKPNKPASSVNPRERAIQRVLLLNAYPCSTSFCGFRA